ncbi:hypothetical protein JOF53_006319 [Crossiella equi]|uniref:Uncharacterized protein n=1 Tax=Crossiella equi TaxID=130796 RepID=A0ABS5AM22_9PSEU|nr:hypothetical protein [Crossiella equi]MBP2477447.1 hypothetical protein [Crossiella equi]
MTRRAPLPGAAELFRSTGSPQNAAVPQRRPEPDESRRGSGRQRHDAKITIYLSAEELLALEQARLTLRAEHGMGVDRGRIVREAVAVLLHDLDAHGADSLLVRRLRAEPAE